MITRANEDFVIDTIPVAEVEQLSMRDAEGKAKTTGPKIESDGAESIRGNIVLLKGLPRTSPHPPRPNQVFH